MREFIPVALPQITKQEIEEVVETLKSRWLTTGEKVLRFEESFKKYVGARYAVAVNSATSGLFLALKVLGIKEGDEVIVPTWTFCATANVVLHCGAKPVLCDVSENFLITPAAIEEKITKKTKAIIPVHFAGRCCPMDEIKELAKKYNLYIIEDAAHAVGTIYKGVKVGNLGDITVFSFYPTKNLTTAEGGVLTTNNEGWAKKAKLYSQHGLSQDAYLRYHKKGSWYYEVLFPGYKFNMTDIQAAIGLVQLSKLERFIKIREKLVALYNEELKALPQIMLPEIEIKDQRVAWHLYCIKLNLNLLEIDRDEFISALRKTNIGTSVHFIPLHLHPYYKNTYSLSPSDFPIATSLFKRVVSLPLYPDLSYSALKYITHCIKKILNKGKKNGKNKNC